MAVVFFHVCQPKTLEPSFSQPCIQSDSKFFRLLENIFKIWLLLTFSVDNTVVEATIISSLGDYNCSLTILPASTHVPESFLHSADISILYKSLSVHSTPLFIMLKVLIMAFKVLQDIAQAHPQIISQPTTNLSAFISYHFPLIQPHWHLYSSGHSPQGLCTCCFLCLQCSSPIYPHGLPPHSLQISAQMSPNLWDLFWAP